MLQSNFTAPVSLSAANANATTVAVTIAVSWKSGPTSRVLASSVGTVNAAAWDAALTFYVVFSNPQPPLLYVPLPTELVGLSGVSLQTFAAGTPQPFFALLVRSVLPVLCLTL
jgi:hypothetical protein